MRAARMTVVIASATAVLVAMHEVTSAGAVASIAEVRDGPRVWRLGRHR